MQKAKEERLNELQKRMPDKELRQWMNNKTEETANMNKESNFNKESFMLGMMCMYSKLNNERNNR